MNRPRRSNRSYVRPRRNSLPGEAPRSKSAARLSRLAGSAERAIVEPLENRQLLFSLVVDPNDPTFVPADIPGYGTVTAEFGYAIPYIGTIEEVEETEPETETEDFDDEPNNPDAGQPIPRGINSNTIFAGSNLIMLHTIAPDLVTGAQRVQLVQQAAGDNALIVGFAAGETFRFRLGSDETGAVVLPMQQIQMFLGAGFNPDFTRVELRLNGDVVGTFQGQSLRDAGPPGGPPGVYTFAPTTIGAFDEIIFTALPGAPATTFEVDNITFTTQANAFASILEARVNPGGARVILTGPIGATARVVDLYGRDMVRTTAVGRPEGAEVILIDPDGNGIPNFNDGIGGIVLSGTDQFTTLTLIGGRIVEGTLYELIDSTLGHVDEMEEGGYGYFFNGEEGATGAPVGLGSVIVGSPYVRPQNNYNPAGVAPGGQNFNRSGQGIFVTEGRSIGGVSIFGVLHGNSQFTGAVDRLAVGYLAGSINVAGDLGALIVATDAGVVEGGAGTFANGAVINAASQLTVGRTVGEIAIAGRSQLSVTVQGDLSRPTARPTRAIYDYFEKEFSYGIDPATQDGEAVINALIAASGTWALNQRIFGGIFGSGMPIAFGDGFFLNDTLLGAEYVGNIGTAVRIHGQLGARDPVSVREDQADVYAFASAGGPVEVRLEGADATLYARIVDHNGRTVAATSLDLQRATAPSQVLRFNPLNPGIYYLVVSLPPANTHPADTDYVVTMAGLAPTTLGSFRTGSSFGGSFGTGAINVLAGSIGAIRVATGYVDGTGNDADPIVVFNDNEDDVDARQTYLSSTVSVAGSLYNITAGGDIVGTAASPVRVIVGGDFGSLVTGLSTIVGVGPTQGDVGPFNLQVGGRIAFLDIKGSIGINQDADGLPFYAPNSTVIRSGASGGNGDIGVIRVGSHIGGSTLVVNTSPGSTVGAFLVSQDIGYDLGDDDIGIYDGQGASFNLGFGSDIRFVDIPQIDLFNSQNAATALIGGQVFEFVDDGGEVIQIQVIGAPAGVNVGRVITLPINGSQGVAIAQIQVDLTGGRRLQITGRGVTGTSDVFSIGRIIITGADAASSIGIVGNDQIDVYRIDQIGGDAMVDIFNDTPFGDIVAIDVVGLTNLDITTGDLGRTQMPSWGPRLIGPFLGVGPGAGGVGEAIGLTQALYDADWNGALYRPINNGAAPAGGAFLDDIGSPVDPYLNGLIVRTGDITRVRVGGAVGDVIAQNGNIITVTANADAITPFGRFDGIVGTIYASGTGGAAGNITLVEIGDGLAASEQSPLSTTGIFADDDIERVVNDARLPNAFISGTIIAGNNTLEAGELGNGIFRIELRGGGDYRDAVIGVSNLDRFWVSVLYGDDNTNNGTILNLLGDGADLFRSVVFAGELVTLRLQNGFFDASSLTTTTGLGTIEAVGFRNSTIAGTGDEYHVNLISTGGNLAILRTLARAGDIEDLVIDVLGSITTEVAARNITRVDLDVDNRIARLQAMNDIRGSRITAGELVEALAGRNIRTSIFNIAGPITLIEAEDSILNSSVNATGPNGRIIDLRATNTITGDISAVNAIGEIVTDTGDIVASITTTGGTGTGNVELVRAGRDLIITTDISGTVDRLIAGRHIGDIGGSTEFILIRGDVLQIDAPNGQIYTDIRVGQRVVERIRIGSAIHKPGNSGLGRPTIEVFGSVLRFEVDGDFGGRLISHSGGIRTVRIEDGSLLPGSLIAAYDGDLHSVKITRGNLYGDLHADYKLVFLTLEADENGVFGDIGVNPAFTSGMAYDFFRNALPPGVAADPTIQGPRITAGTNLGRVEVRGGSVFESFFHAGRALGTLFVAENISSDPFTGGRTTVIAAGSLINTVRVDGNLSDALIIAGVLGFGADGRPGGLTTADADVLNTGRVFNVNVGGDARNVAVSAGMDPGADGVYNTDDDLVVPGRSLVRHVRVSGDVDDVSIYTDLPVETAKSGIVRRTTQPNLDPDIAGGSPPGVQLPNGEAFRFTWQDDAGTIRFSGPGRAYWDADRGRIVLVNTVNESSLIVDADDGSLADFDIVTNDDASIGSIIVNADLSGDSDIVIDAFSLNVQVGNFSGTGDIRAGMNIRQLTTGSFTSTGHIKARFMRFITINGDFGSTAVSNNDRSAESNIDLQTGRLITVNGVMAGIINVDRTIQIAASTVHRGSIRAGDRIVSFNAGTVRESHISANNGIDTINVTGNVIDSSFIAGGDLGADAVFGGQEADEVTSGQIGTVTIGGNFTESDIVAGVLRGADGFFGTTDDSVAAGRSSIGSVSIGGTQVGSNVNSEQYRITSTGTIGAVTIGGTAGTDRGNFRIVRLTNQPAPIRVNDLSVTPVAGQFIGRIEFNQAIDSSTVGAALTISEIRDGGLTLIPLQLGVDYTLSFDEGANVARIVFSRQVTDRSLAADGSLNPLPGPGVYRFELDADVLRATVADARLDGNADGAAQTNDDFSEDRIVGDAGDKIGPVRVVDGDGNVIDFYGPADLDLVMDDNRSPDGLPDANKAIMVRGTLGDHPDSNSTSFRFSGDTDVYKITLQAGQILRLGQIGGTAAFATRVLFNADGSPQFGNTADTMQMSVNSPELFELTTEDAYLIKTTGVYYVVVGNSFAFADPDVIPNPEPVAGTLGDYAFSLEVFDDGDSGFAADTDAGNGAPVVNAPHPDAFAGNDGRLGTGDDLDAIEIGDFIFTINDGVVSGTNRNGITSVREADGRLVTTIDSAIGTPGHRGVPADNISPDVDIFHLNNGQLIGNGVRIRITVRLSDLGADLGSRRQASVDSATFSTITDFSGLVQFAVFDTTAATGIGDANLVFSPTDFRSTAAQPGVIADNGQTSYGYDEDGNFFVEFLTPGHRDAEGNERFSSYAVYLQGAFNTDYQIEVAQQGVGTIQRQTQNIFIETRGGIIDWLEVGGFDTNLEAFDAAALGFTGTIGAQPVGTYILNRLISNLQTVFAAAGVDVRISLNPADFEFEDFSTVFISNSFDPVNPIISSIFGVSEHADVLNADNEDEAVVFVPSLGTLGLDPSQAGANAFADSLTSAVGRRIGELLGLRMTTNDFSDNGDIMAQNSVLFPSSPSLFSEFSRPLSSPFDGSSASLFQPLGLLDDYDNTDFFLGQQNAVSLLDLILRD